jgi:hypothetical protein
MPDSKQRNKTLTHHLKISRSNIARKQHRLYQAITSKFIVISCILGLIALVAISHNYDGTIKASASVHGAKFTMTRCPIGQ